MDQVLFERQFDLSYENLAPIRQALGDRAQALQLAPDLMQNIKLVCSEYCANLLEHQQTPASRCTISYGKTAGQYCFAIADNGSPWPAQTEHLESAELPLQPCESGMGLAIIKATFPDFRYQVLPDSNKIEFTLPRQSDRKHLVIVDDSRSQLAMLTSYLEDAFQLSIFSQADEAQAWLQANHCDLVLTDLWMPDINGLEFRRAVANIRHHRMLPFVFLSGDTVSDTMKAVSESGIDDFLAKPIDKHHLLQVLGRVLKHHQHLQSAFEDNMLQRLESRSCNDSGSSTTTISTGGFNIQLSREPAISGDFFIHHPLPGGGSMVILGDLMGHGLVARANGGICYGLIQGLLLDPTITPEQLCQRLNQHLYLSEAASLVCLLVILLDTDGSITLYNAGMPKPIACRSCCEHLKESIGLMGLFDSPEIEGVSIQLRPGHSLHGYTDGLLESMLSEQECQEMKAMTADERHHYLWQRAPENYEDDRTLFTLTHT